MGQKRCSCCEQLKPESDFAERGDSWGTYAWCNGCRVLLDRDKTTKAQNDYLKKTEVFKVRD